MANIRTRRLRRWEIGCGLTAAALGTALHFACRWGGESRLLAVFAAANGSVWEQMKVLFFPLFLMALVEMVVFAQRYRNILAVKFVSVLFGVLLLPLLYYAYTGVWGRSWVWADAAVFYLCAAASQYLSCRLLERGRLEGGGGQVAGLFGLWGLAFLFVYLSCRPPALAIFQVPAAGGFGP